MPIELRKNPDMSRSPTYPLTRGLGCAASVAVLLGGCAVMSPGGSPHVAKQPLQRVQVEQAGAADDPLTLELAAEFALADGNLVEASKDYARAARLSDDAQVVARAVQVAMAARQWRQVRALTQRWQTLKPDDPSLWQARASIALHDGRANAAFAELRRLAEQPDAAGWRGVARVLMQAMDKQQSADVLQRLAIPELLGDRVKTWVAASQLAAHLQDLATARAVADAATQRFNDADAFIWSAQLRYRAGDTAGAKAVFTEALRHNGDSVPLRRAYAALLGNTGESAAAARVLSHGKQDDYSYSARAAYAARADNRRQLAQLYAELKALPPPRSGERLNLLGELAELLKLKHEALGWYRKVPEDDAHWFSAQLRCALLLDTTGKSPAALDLVHRLQAHAGDDSKQLGDAFLLEAEMLDRHTHREAALSVYDRGLLTLPDDTRLLYARALLNDDLGHVGAAVRDLRRLVKLDPDNADALNALGYTLADHAQNQDEALSLIEKALALKPGEPAIIDSLGWVQYRLGNLDEAIKQLRSAYARQPDPEIAAHLGEVLWKAGHKDEARKVWAQGRKKDAKNKVLLETINRLSS